MTVEPIFLWLVLCLDGSACNDSQAYQLDKFEGPAAVFDCDEQERENRVELATHTLPEWRIGCKTVAAFDKEGL